MKKLNTEYWKKLLETVAFSNGEISLYELVQKEHRHFHPSGNLVSSKEDKALTQRLVDIFRPLDIIIVDHIIVGGPHFISMAEEACLPVDTLDKANYDAIELVDQVVKEDLTHENILSYGSM